METSTLAAEVARIVRDVVGAENVQTTQQGRLEVHTWIGGTLLSSVQEALEVLDVTWHQLDQVQVQIWERTGNGVAGPLVARIERDISLLALAYGYMVLMTRYPCECGPLATWPEEAHQLFRDSLVQVDAEEVTAHPILQETGYSSADLTRMAELYAVLAGDDGNTDDSYEEVYCQAGHFEGLHQLSCR